MSITPWSGGFEIKYHIPKWLLVLKWLLVCGEFVGHQRFSSQGAIWIVFKLTGNLTVCSTVNAGSHQRILALLYPLRESIGSWSILSTKKCNVKCVKIFSVAGIPTRTGEYLIHDDVIKWKHFPRYWPYVMKNHRSPVDSPHKGQWREALMFSLMCAWTQMNWDAIALFKTSQ